ncbi:interferon-induced protein 44 [Xyrauchen texanus]|uniref:interferon-induced protein 44 n=1 Tax=Xyrauchen texanus TaxID=154827 RepID=UPI002242A9F9|nr:interferon-induced protein 44 [Xyrauchen texanus]
MFSQIWQQKDILLQGQFDKPWRSVDWSDGEKQTLLRKLHDFETGNPEVSSLRILLHGPVGAGKSSFINSVDSSLRGRTTTRALADSAVGTSFTLAYKEYKLKKERTGSFFPFMFADLRGFEEDCGLGIKTTDVIKTLNGRVKNGYVFNPNTHITKDDTLYNKDPSLSDKVHCLVGIFPTDKISLIGENTIRKMREIREDAQKLGIPQVIIMTKVDAACPLVKEDLQNIYKSKTIKEKMELCSVKLGIPVNCIYPVKNYHEEDATNTSMDILILKALQHVVNFANDYVEYMVVDK